MKKQSRDGEVFEISAPLIIDAETYQRYLEVRRKQAGLEELNAVPQTDEERLEQFEIKRRVVNTLVEKVTILINSELKITFRLNLLALVQRYFSVDQVPPA